jgi:hypothetical protein
MELGKARYSGERKEIFKLEKGDNVFRFFPPMGKLAQKGWVSSYYSIVWGYKDSKGNNRPFNSPRKQNFKTKMIEVDCAAYNRVEKLKAKHAGLLKQAQDLAKSGVPIPTKLKEDLEESKKTVKRFNIANKHNFNGMRLDGKIGLIPLGTKAKQALMELCKKLESEGIDAMGINGGRFFTINKSGEGRDTAYAVSEYKERAKVMIGGVETLVDVPKPHDLTNDILNRLDSEAFELSELYPSPTSEQVKAIVDAYERSEQEGSLMVDKIFGDKESLVNEDPEEEYNAKAETRINQRSEAVKESPVTSAQEAAQAALLAKAAADKAKADEEARLKAEEEKKKAAEAATKATMTKVETVSNLAQSDVDFLKELESMMG